MASCLRDGEIVLRYISFFNPPRGPLLAGALSPTTAAQRLKGDLIALGVPLSSPLVAPLPH